MGKITDDLKETTDFQKVKADEALRLLKSDLNIGLKEVEVEERLKHYGYNEVPEKKTNPIVLFVKKFWGLTHGCLRS